MSTSAARPRPALSPLARRIIGVVVVVVVLGAMVLSTKFVPKGSALDQQDTAFSATAFARKEFPVVQKFVSSKAVDAVTLATAAQADPAAAGKKYGVVTEGGVGTEVPVSFTGVVGQVQTSGSTPVAVSGLPPGVVVTVQLGPAINGTDLRDSTGKYRLGTFENQIQYQDAASALNDQLKKVLTSAGAPKLEGKTIQVEGVFNLVNPLQWNVTPATLKVQG